MTVKPDRMNGASKTTASAEGEQHIRNRRLFHFAAGKIQLARWEREHLHACTVCQRMGYVLVRSIHQFNV